MARRNSKQTPDEITLLERVIASRCRRLAVVGLHAGSGSSTVLTVLARGLAARDEPVGVTAVPGQPLDEDPSYVPIERTTLPAGILVATAAGAGDGCTATLDLVESTDLATPVGKIVIQRVRDEGTVGLYGPTDPVAVSRLSSRLGELTGGTSLVLGGWERRAFAAPDGTDAIVLAAGAGMSGSTERTAAAVRAHVDRLALPECDEMRRLAWEVARSRGEAAVVDVTGRVVDSIPLEPETPDGLADRLTAVRAACLAIPSVLDDDLLRPLSRDRFHCGLVVRDATRIHVAPVYYDAWLKSGGRFEVVRPSRLLAVTTCPVNLRGDDADAVDFRDQVAVTVAGIPVHDVVLEESRKRKRRSWRIWGAS
jgi:hypothetical protein